MCSFENCLNFYELKTNELYDLINVDKIIKEKVIELFKFKEEFTDIICLERIKLNHLKNDMDANITRIEKILNDSVIYPRVIGKNNKHKTFHDLIDYILSEISLNSMFRKKIF